MSGLQAATDAVKALLRAQSLRICWPQAGILDAIKAAEAAKEAVDALPKLEVASYPIYPSVDDGQTGCVIAAHLSDEQMLGVPLHLANEMLDELATSAAGANWQSSREKQRLQILSAYGLELADLICQGIDEALEGRSQSHKRLRDWDGKRHGPLDSTEIDEPLYEDCEPDAEHASPTTSFDFEDAIGSAGELIEQRDRAASDARYGSGIAA